MKKESEEHSWKIHPQTGLLKFSFVEGATITGPHQFS